MHTSLPLLRFCTLLLLLLGWSTFSSFERVEHEPPPRTQQTSISKQQQRRFDRLQRRLARTKRPRHQIRLKQRIKRLEHRQATGATALWSVLGLVASILAVLVLFVGLVISAAGALSGGAGALGMGTALFVLGLVLALIGLGLSIAVLVLHRTRPERFTKPGFALAGLIISGLLLGFLILATVGSMFS